MYKSRFQRPRSLVNELQSEVYNPPDFSAASYVP